MWKGINLWVVIAMMNAFYYKIEEVLLVAKTNCNSYKFY